MNLPEFKSTKNNDKLAQALSDFYRRLEASQKPLEPEFQKVLDDNFWDLLIKDDDLHKGIHGGVGGSNSIWKKP